MQPPLLANELNPKVILLGLFVLIITLLFALPRFQRVKLVIELIFEAVQTLVRIVVIFQQLIHNLHQIISMAHDGFKQDVLKLIFDVAKSLVSLVDQLQRLIRTCREIWSIWTARQPADIANEHHVRIAVIFQQLIHNLHQIISMAHDGFKQDVLKLIFDLAKSLVSLVDQLQQLIRTCREIWSIWTARQPAAVANEHQSEVPPIDAEATYAANGRNDVIVNEELNI